MDETPRVRRRWHWYGLPVLLGVIALLVAIGVSRFRSWFAVKLEEAERQRAAVELVKRLGGYVGYDFERRFGEYAAREHLSEGERPPLPGLTWLRERYGLDMFATVESVGFGPQQPGDDRVLDDAGLRQLEEHLKSLPRLDSISFYRTKITDAGLKHLAGLAQLKRLSINGSPITDSGLEQIGTLANLERLSIGLPDTTVEETGITDNGLRHLAQLKNLKSLRLYPTRIAGPGLRYLEGLESLEYLEIEHSRITDDGLLKLGKLAGFPVLERISLSGNPLRGPGLACLSGLPRLHTLWLNGTEVDDEGTEFLAGFHHLKQLGLRGTPVTHTGVGKIRDALGTWNVRIDGVD